MDKELDEIVELLKEISQKLDQIITQPKQTIINFPKADNPWRPPQEGTTTSPFWDKAMCGRPFCTRGGDGK